MTKEKRTTAGAEKRDGAGGGRVVYSRLRGRGEADAPEEVKTKDGPSGEAPLDHADQRAGSSSPPERISLAPTLMPLLIGFALLIVLVIGLGLLSRDKLQDVTLDAMQLERRYAGTLQYLYQLEGAMIKLDNEARVRARVDGHAGLRPPFGVRLRNARREVNESLEMFERLPLAESQAGQAFRQDVRNYLAITDDLDRYSHEGFDAFQKVEKGLDGFINEAKHEHELIPGIIEANENAARSRINLLTMLAVLTGSLFASGAIWEVQRRFRQIRSSVDELRRERQFNSQMLEGMVSAIAAIDSQDRIRSANAAFLQAFPGANIGASVHDKLTTPEGTRLLQVATATRVARSTYRGRFTLHQDSEPAEQSRSYDVYSSPLDIDGDVGQLLTMVDVTEAAQSEAELRRQEALAAVGQAAAQVAHEIKNPLGSIRLGVAMLRDMTDNHEAHATIDLVERGIDHLNKLTIDVTQFSRHKQLMLTPVELSFLLDSSLDLVADKIKEKCTPIEKNFSEEAIHLEADADSLRQVFVNLFANAIEVSPPGAPLRITTTRISVERKRAGSAGHASGLATVDDGTGGLLSFARIEIADQGGGMDEPTRARIFEPFFTTKKRGTGLGLAIAKQLVEQHLGRINVASAPGQGTRFTIDLPMETVNGEK